MNERIYESMVGRTNDWMNEIMILLIPGLIKDTHVQLISAVIISHYLY